MHTITLYNAPYLFSFLLQAVHNRINQYLFVELLQIMSASVCEFSHFLHPNYIQEKNKFQSTMLKKMLN